jgi:DNA repair exonuclease SbcCD nuclease subunit
MIKKLIQISDIHIRTYKRHDECKEVLTQFFDEIRDFAKDYSPEELRIVITGDVVHQKITISPELVGFVAWFFREASSICPVVIIAGNHDLIEDNQDRMDSLTPIVEILNDDNIHYFKKSECILDDNLVWCVYSIFEHNQRPQIYDAIKQYGKDKTYVGLFHAPILGSKTAAGYEFKDSGVGLDYFDGLNIVLAGDIHMRQSFSMGGLKDNVAMAGSCLQNDFGESIQGHGYLIWDVETRTFTAHDIDSDYGFYKFQINGLDDLTAGAEILLNK